MRYLKRRRRKRRTSTLAEARRSHRRWQKAYRICFALMLAGLVTFVYGASQLRTQLHPSATLPVTAFIVMMIFAVATLVTSIVRDQKKLRLQEVKDEYVKRGKEAGLRRFPPSHGRWHEGRGYRRKPSSMSLLEDSPPTTWPAPTPIRRLGSPRSARPPR